MKRERIIGIAVTQQAADEDALRDMRAALVAFGAAHAMLSSQMPLALCAMRAAQHVAEAMHILCAEVIEETISS